MSVNYHVFSSIHASLLLGNPPIWSCDFQTLSRRYLRNRGYGHSSVCLHHENGYHSDSNLHFDSILNSDYSQHTNGKLTFLFAH